MCIFYRKCYLHNLGKGGKSDFFIEAEQVTYIINGLGNEGNCSYRAEVMFELRTEGPEYPVSNFTTEISTKKGGCSVITKNKLHLWVLLGLLLIKTIFKIL